MIEPPESIKAFASVPVPGHWFQCTIDKGHVGHNWTKPHHVNDRYVVAHHATRITNALNIIYQGSVGAGLGQSAGFV